MSSHAYYPTAKALHLLTAALWIVAWFSAAHKVAGAPCLRTPYHPHQLAGIISGLQATVAPGGGESQKAA
ncbi:hypothetical protein [Methylobacterium soli]|uniref:Uncharacterized protein n=1 Tax=Methylobacterium soli TaxID=553447 RepID=A0A6L3SZV4_9HYPH|nr:hypothetical protein [Methylobacterium soli]KAB1077914.1 hypothetical protein F6X53_17085 [Methylobacterium soli]